MQVSFSLTPPQIVLEVTRRRSGLPAGDLVHLGNTSVVSLPIQNSASGDTDALWTC